MTPEQWTRVRGLLEQALELPEAERTTFVDAELASEDELRGVLHTMLGSADPCEQFIEPPEEVPGPERLASPLPSGERIGSYRILRLLGVGGMGAVYEAEQEDPSRRVALKILQATQASPSGLRRFRDEVQMLASLRHPAIAHIHEVGTQTVAGIEVPWFTMELVEDARDLITWADEEGASRDERLRIFGELCAAVRHGHARGLIHRDLKPSNVLVGGDGHLKLIDFGIARALDGSPLASTAHTRTAGLIGTPQCMAPEQLEDGADLDVRCDVYALGAMLFELLCGAPPLDLENRSLTAVLRALRDEEPRRPSSFDPTLAGDLEWILLKALEKDRERRYASVAELEEDLRRHAAHEPISAGPPDARYRLAKFARRNKLLVSVTAAILVGLLLAITGTTVGMFEARAAAEDALQAEGEARAAEAEARQEATKNRLVLDLVAGLFDGIEDTVEGRDVRVVDLLDAAVLDFDAEVASDPEVELVFRTLLGKVYYEIDRFDSAEPQLARAMALLETLDRETLTPAERLEVEMFVGANWTQHGRPEEGEARLRATLASAEAEGLVALQVATFDHLLQYLVNEGSYEEVARLAERMRALAVEAGDERAEAQARSRLGAALAHLSRFDEATSLNEETWLQQAARHGDDSPEAALALQEYAFSLARAASMGRALKRRGSYEETKPLEEWQEDYLDRAEEVCAQAVPLVRKHFGPTHTRTLNALSDQAGMVYMRGDFERAVELYIEVVDAFDSRAEPSTQSHARAVHNLALSIQMTEDYVGAEPVFRRAVTMGEELMAPDDVVLATYRLHLGVCIGWIPGRFEEAESILLEAYDVLYGRLPRGHRARRLAVQKIRVFYLTNSDPTEAERWSAMLEEEVAEE